MFVLRRASRGSVQLVVCLWLCAAVFLCTLLKSESFASWASFRSRSILQPSRRVSSLARRCDPPADALRSTLIDAAAGENAPEGDAPEGSTAEPAAAGAEDATEIKGVHDFKVGEVIEGKVRNRNKGVTWVDIGIPKGAWLLGEKKQKIKLDIGEQLKGLVVEEVDIEKGWISVTLPDLESLVKDRPAPPSPSPPPAKKKTKAEPSPTDQAQSATAGGVSTKTAAIKVGGNTGTTKIGLGDASTLELMIAGVAVSDLDVDYESGRIVIGLGEQAAKPTKKAKAKQPPAKAEPPQAKAKSAPKQKPPITAEELADIEDLEVGATLKGKVVTKNRGGVWFGIGKIHDAKVKLLKKIEAKLEWGEELDVTIINIDKETARVTVSISEQDQAKIFAREVSKRSMTSFEVGEIVNGYVAQANRVGIFVDIGAEKDALLRKESSLTGSIKNGDKLENLKVVEVNATARTITLTVPEDSRGSGDADES